MILVRRYNIAYNLSNMYDIRYLSFDKNSFLSIVILYFFQRESIYNNILLH